MNFANKKDLKKREILVNQCYACLTPLCSCSARSSSISFVIEITEN